MLRLAMKRLVLGPLTSPTVAALMAAAFVLSGCLKAVSQTAANDQTTVSQKSTNAMDKFEKPPAADLKKKLTPMQFEVTQHAATEPAFRNEFWDNHKHGLYVDIVSGKPLFSSLDKFDSGCGWASFSKTIVENEGAEPKDNAYR